MMNQDNSQENNPNASEDFLLKPKRGRPRKHPKYTLHEGQDARTPCNQNPNRIPPGFEGVNGNRSQQMNPINDANDITVGQAVSGVIDAAFDAGYLLTVRVGDTDTTLRGVVFKPGNFVPVSAENDVAPNLQMIRRNEIPFPHERNGTALPVNGPALSNQVPCARASNTGALKSKHMQSGATQYVSPLLSRGTVVPVVLKPAAGFSNGKVASQQLSQPPHLAACKGKQVSGDANTAKENPVNPMPMAGNQIFPTQPQSNNYNVPKGMQSETVPYGQLPTEGLHDKDPKSMTDMPFEKLLTEVMKRVQVPAQSPGSQNGNSTVKYFGHKMEDDQPLSIEPLQAIQPTHPTVFKPLENFRTGKMTELLQAVQENMRENQASHIEQTAIGSEETERSRKT